MVTVFKLGLIRYTVFSGIYFLSTTVTVAQEPTIDIWYGNPQRFGHLGGHPQRWINVLGSAKPADSIETLSFRLNAGNSQPLSFHEDRKRIARDGDFNIEIARSALKNGENSVAIEATTNNGKVKRQVVTLLYTTAESGWPLPYSIDWSQIERIEDAAQVIDGQWELTPAGIRSVGRYYDRVIALGDATWRDYEVSTTVTIHALTPPRTGPNDTHVTHAAIALRWPGHDPDGLQPSVKWHPLGATAEFRLGGDLQECRWRIFDGQRPFHRESTHRRKLEFEKVYGMKHRVETLPNGDSRYRAKLWPADQTEPAAWDLVRIEPDDDVPTGSALLLAHHSDVTFGNVTVVPVR